MLDLTTPHPLSSIVESVGAKTPLGSAMRTAEWERMPAGLRDAAFFSASVESSRWLQRAQAGITDIIAKARATNERGESYWKEDRASLLADLRRYGESIALRRPGGRDGKIRENDITDPLSVARLRLIINIQMELAYGKAEWLTSMDPDILAAFPAWELVRISPRAMPRDWLARWRAAGGQLSDGGRMIALKPDPIWKALSRFENPHPPFDFNSGMGVEDVDRAEAEDLGLIGPDDELMPNVAAHQDSLKASLKGFQDPQALEALKALLKPRFTTTVDPVRKEILATPVKAKPVKAKPVKAKPVKAKPADATPVKASTSPEELLERDTLADDFAKKFNCKVVFSLPDPKWGTEMTVAAQIQHLKAVGAEWERLRAAFPLMPATTVKTFACVTSDRGRAHVDGPDPYLSTKTAESAWSAASWANIETWEALNKRSWGTERKGSQVEDNFRHELGHVMTTPLVKFEFLATILSKYKLKWFRQNISEYSATDREEAVADLFGLCTREDYVRGTLPEEVEAFIFKFMLKEV